MAAHQVVYTPEAHTHLLRLYRYIADDSSPAVARAVTDAIVDQCESLGQTPDRGTPREDLGPGLRTIPFHRHVVIANTVSEETVTIVGIFYAGRDDEMLPERE